ncbi:DNA-binding response OmpR family regulator [Anaerobacterium chartisolvens]|uniref:Stage 0 sporulation protein A homolog n=1 Tax=Anaerobacterium chartisolvens TaxID=1297424 RepID=A0A369B9S6_9FIRM|nr:response regulator transcription factor [Anaerobacterium chartisolvens]RCX18272.1 DNA-binding response OmpR family regulator [Anaerobacterium chartisolvens]
MQNRILLVEDDISISEMLKDYLQKEGFIVKAAFDGEEGVSEFFKASFELVILDIMMPKLNGIEAMRIIRERSSIPIVLVSAKGTDVDKAIGLGLGADDYISKPFSMIEFSARIKAAIRRSIRYSHDNKNEKPKLLNIHDIIIDPDNFSVTKNGESIKLTSKEFDILKLFATNPGRVFTKAQIYTSVWEDDYFGDENVINVHMRRLREKIEHDPSNPQYIKTLWGIGYKLGEA